MRELWEALLEADWRELVADFGVLTLICFDLWLLVVIVGGVQS